MQRILLYYKFTPVKDPESVRLWQTALCERLNLKGRIIVSEHGINGTVGGELSDLKQYARATKSYESFRAMKFKWSDGSAEDFPRLSIKVRPEIVTFGAEQDIEVDQNGIVGGGKHLSPKQVHELIRKRDKDVVFFDGRNAYEAEVGKFKGAVVSGVEHTRDFKDELKKPKYKGLKDKAVVTYCTGGIRCEVLSMLMKKNGFKDVYQIEGGIVKYGEEYGDEGLWEGSLYVFDGRMGTKFSAKARDIGTCTDCKTKTSNYENCANLSCNRLILICDSCKVSGSRYCSKCVKASTAV
jgi:UPF0176 protein